MYRNQKIGVVVPCYNEELQIESVIATMPEWVERIYVVDDCSKDRTSQKTLELKVKYPKVELLRHEVNSGVGTAIGTGYAKASQEGMDVTAVMAGDGQMDPDDLPRLIDPIVENTLDYCKGNRFIYAGGLKKIPRLRLFGNFVLSALTKLSSGYWHVSDTQCGYTTISLEAIRSIEVDKIYPSYGCPNDILTKLNIACMRVGEAPVYPRYNVGEQSKMKIPRIIGPILRLLCRNFVSRIFQKYVVRKGHPLVIAYGVSLIGFALVLTLSFYILSHLLWTGEIPKAALILTGFSFISALHLLITAIEMDFNDNKDLQVLLPTPRSHRLQTELTQGVAHV